MKLNNPILTAFIFTVVVFFPASVSDLLAFQTQESSSNALSTKIDDYIDARFDGTKQATENLITELNKSGIAKLSEMEKLLRARRTEYPDATNLIGKITQHEVDCLHVDYSSDFFLFVPEDINLEKPVALIVVGHGGNSSMSKRRAAGTAKSYIQIYSQGITQDFNAVAIAPSSERGWGQIGNSLILSSISKVQRILPIDPDRIYMTGQSMGGHLSYRSALTLPDRWGAVSPHSGGYDFVEKKSIENLFNVPGYSIWGKREPFGINKDNRTNQKWAKENDLNWKFIEKNGGHIIYQDELPKVAKFFKSNPRNLYPDRVYFRAGGHMKFVNTWQIKTWPKHKVYHETKPLRWNLRHWLEVQPRPDLKEPIIVRAQITKENRFEITTVNVQKFSLLLHPKMADFEKPIIVVANGKQLFQEKIDTDPRLMFELAREFDDRGRIYWAKINLQIGPENESTP